MQTHLPDDVADAWAEVFLDLYRKDCAAENEEAGSPGKESQIRATDNPRTGDRPCR